MMPNSDKKSEHSGTKTKSEVLMSRLRQEETLALEVGQRKYWTEVRKGMREMFVRGENSPLWRS